MPTIQLVKLGTVCVNYYIVGRTLTSTILFMECRTNAPDVITQLAQLIIGIVSTTQSLELTADAFVVCPNSVPFCTGVSFKRCTVLVY